MNANTGNWKRRRRKASALITTLLVVVILSTIVVAFMQSMSVERLTARSLKNVYQAQLAAEAAQAEAVDRIRSLMLANPYHGIGYTNIPYTINGNTYTNTYTILAGATSYSPAPNGVTNYYLLSGTNETKPPSGMVVTNSVAINQRESSTDNYGWMGSPVSVNSANGMPTYRECRAPWVYILQDPSKSHDANRSSPNYNPYIARYAWWVEDETSKLDLRLAGNKDGTGGGFLRTTNSISPADLDIGAAPFVNGRPVATNDSSFNQQIIIFRDTISGLPVDGRSVGQGISADAERSTRFYLTAGSYANDLTGSGQKRVNLNALVNNNTNPASIAANLDDIIYIITGNHDSVLRSQGLAETSRFRNLPNTNGPLTNFGSRFYTNTAPTLPHKAIYMKKIAANIRDYMDADSLPTLVSTNGTVSTSGLTGAWWNNWPPQALGKEAIPYLQETAWAGVEIAWSGSGSSPRTATLEIDHYLELFNPSTKDFTFPTGSKINLSNLSRWLAVPYPNIEPADFDIDISGIVVPAGGVKVITTNPGPAANDPPGLIKPQNAARVERRPPPVTAQEGIRRFTNRLTSQDTGGGIIGFKMENRGDSTVSDTRSRVIISGPGGIYDAFAAYGFTGVVDTPWHFRGQNVGNRTRFVYDSSLAGNSADGRSGDPRSLNEQLQFVAFGTAQDATRFYGNIQGGGPPGTATLGEAKLSFIDPKKAAGATGAWGDYNDDFDDTRNTAYAVIKDGPMFSIGELGNIYDPYRLSSPSGINASRGGGRTLKIGQPDDTIGAAPRFSALWHNAAWRLMDILGIDVNSGNVELDAQSEGKININSVLRDNGVAMKAFLRQLVFLASPNSDPATAGKALSDTEVDALVASINSYLTTKGPLMERGELSEVSFFSGASSNTSKVGGATVKTVNDRGREEIFRRIVEMITTRSDSFSVFAVGEAIREDNNGKIYSLGRSWNAAVYRFDPVIGAGLRDRVTEFQTARIYERK